MDDEGGVIKMRTAEDLWGELSSDDYDTDEALEKARSSKPKVLGGGERGSRVYSKSERTLTLTTPPDPISIDTTRLHNNATETMSHTYSTPHSSLLAGRLKKKSTIPDADKDSDSDSDSEDDEKARAKKVR